MKNVVWVVQNSQKHGIIRAYVDHVQLSWEGGEENEERGLGCVKQPETWYYQSLRRSCPVVLGGGEENEERGLGCVKQPKTWYYQKTRTFHQLYQCS